MSIRFEEEHSLSLKIKRRFSFHFHVWKWFPGEIFKPLTPAWKMICGKKTLVQSSSGSKRFVLEFRWVFIVTIVFIGLEFFLIPRFVSVTVQFELIVHDNFLFLSSSFYKRVFCVFVRQSGFSCRCMCIYFCVSSLLFFSP